LTALSVSFTFPVCPAAGLAISVGDPLIETLGGDRRPGKTISVVALIWDEPSTNSDSSELTDLSGYRVYFGGAPRGESDAPPAGYGQMIDVLRPNNCETFPSTDKCRYKVFLPAGTWYFSVTAYNSQGVESGYSNEVSKSVQ
jgi:hypothetical protein